MNVTSVNSDCMNMLNPKYDVALTSVYIFERPIFVGNARIILSVIWHRRR